MNQILPKEQRLFVLLSSASFLLLFGIPTSLIPNPLFMRMTQTNLLDYFLLISTSLLLGAYLGLYRQKKSHSSKACKASYAGGAAGFFGFACPICNKLLVMLLGLAGVVMYIEPVRYALGIIGIAEMTYAVAEESKAL
jgi:predicted ABC-type exoprotein transport system permease subunit